ncbi:RsmB/NOP family class I SAM-dependent RNA methyltransferase [Sedimentitalea sp. HM32M-2]|uniref:RsmB/NOP family class I SAM-dependent RNA methyltransferase n=1 Tax=Sedimentitalea sp. HM32M-2 TaxID=3351566 RepID=UPI00363408F1
MTPAARVQAAIEVLDRILAGTAAEQALTGWARRSRFAGSRDRAAIRDHVFGVLRCKRTCAALGGAETGRGLMLGWLRQSDTDPDTVFGAGPYAPDPLTDQECAAGAPPLPGAEAMDLPDWLWPRFRAALGENAAAAATALKFRAAVHLRVNLGKATIGAAQKVLLQDGIQTQPHPAADTALLVTEGARRVRQSAAYLSGLVELQDAASQAVVQTLPLRDGMRVLDYCAGGGGKTLALAARARVRLFAHDAAPQRMRDLAGRARRAGVQVTQLQTSQLAAQGPFDLVLCDAPCSGSGAWRRSPAGKWALTQAGLRDLCALQARILSQAAPLVAPGGVLAYATCSFLVEENADQISGFLAQYPGWRVDAQQSWSVQDGADGFFAAHLTRDG